MKKFKLTCLAIALCGIFSMNSLNAQDDGGGFDGGGFDGGFDGGDFGGGDFDGGYDGDFSGSYEDYSSGGFESDTGADFDGLNADEAYSDSDNQNDFGQDDAFYDNQDFNQPSDGNLTDSPESGYDSGAIDALEDNDLATERNTDQAIDAVQNAREVMPESSNRELTGQSEQTPDTDTTTGARNLEESANPAETTDTSATADSAVAGDTATAEGGVAPTNDAGAQAADTENNNTVNQNHDNQNPNNQDHGHHEWGHHHHHNDFALGLGLGLGLGWGFGPFGLYNPYLPFGFYSPFSPFGYYGFGMPVNSVGFYAGRYGASNVTFGPYRYFEPYYPLGAYPSTVAPVFGAPAGPPVFVQRNEPSRPAVAPAPAQNRNYWHYCRDPKGYYPYVKQCTHEWIKVPPQPS